MKIGHVPASVSISAWDRCIKIYWLPFGCCMIQCGNWPRFI